MKRIAFAVAAVVCGVLAVLLAWPARQAPLAPAPAIERLSVSRTSEGKLGKKEEAQAKGPASAQLLAQKKDPGALVAGPGVGGLGMSGTGQGGGARGIGIGGIGTRGAGGGSYGRGISSALSGNGGIGLAGIGAGAGYRAPRAGILSEGAPASERYGSYGINPFVLATEDHLSTFAVDVDTASYAIARRKLLEGSLPPPEAVRVEEFLNYFRYQYPRPETGTLAVHLDAAPSPFHPERHLLRVGVQGKRLSVSERKPSHLTFLVDVSGSMASPDKLPLVKRCLRTLVDNLRDGDTVALVTYASGSRVVLPATGLEHKAVLYQAIEDLVASGSTAMGGGIELAYQEAMKTKDGSSNSRVIILSDGDANVGAVSSVALLNRIAGYAKEGITVSTVGFGMGNYNDELMEQFANKGNGNHHYVDSPMEAKKIFQAQLGGTLEVIAKDVKLQVEFDPEQVKSYRLVGYENRDLADRDFRDDRVDAGEIGAGHTVTALYELELRPGAGEGLATVRVRAKRPAESTAHEAAFRFSAHALANSFERGNPDLRFATAVMGAAEIFRRSPHAKTWSYDQVLSIAEAASPEGNAEREEFIGLLRQARALVNQVASR